MDFSKQKPGAKVVPQGQGRYSVESLQQPGPYMREWLAKWGPLQPKSGLTPFNRVGSISGLPNDFSDTLRKIGLQQLLGNLDLVDPRVVGSTDYGELIPEKRWDQNQERHDWNRREMEMRRAKERGIPADQVFKQPKEPKK